MNIHMTICVIYSVKLKSAVHIFLIFLYFSFSSFCLETRSWREVMFLKTVLNSNCCTLSYLNKIKASDIVCVFVYVVMKVFYRCLQLWTLSPPIWCWVNWKADKQQKDGLRCKLKGRYSPRFLSLEKQCVLLTVFLKKYWKSLKHCWVGL